MSSQSTPTYLLIGTVTKDIQDDGGFTTGGTVTYAATIAQKMGWTPVIITRAASDFVPPVHLADATWHVLPASDTTTYRNDYYPEGRIQTIGPIAEGMIRGSDVPSKYRQADLIHLCPLAQDVDPEVTSVFPKALLTATLQGWLRQWDSEGIVSLGGWQKMKPVMPWLQTAVISTEDIEGDWQIAEQLAKLISILIVTEGEDGCTVFHDDNRFSAPPRPATPLDLTGAGDVFAAAFFIRYYETNDLAASARFANVTASMALERPGVEGAPSRAEVEAYLAQHP